LIDYRIDILLLERTHVKQYSAIWHRWAKTLNHWGIQDLIATLLEVLGPLSLFGAQLVYAGQPLLSAFVHPKNLHELAVLLEDQQETQAFIAFLRQTDHNASTHPTEESQL
jgi:hypothetical protein